MDEKGPEIRSIRDAIDLAFNPPINKDQLEKYAREEKDRFDQMGADAYFDDIARKKILQEQEEEILRKGREFLHARVDIAEHRSVHDELTGLPNRAFLEEVYPKLLAQAERYKHPLTELGLDLDDMKKINDEFGHRAGDAFLVEVAGVLEKALRGSDLAARVGGDEFRIVLPETDEEEGRKVAERIREEINSIEFLDKVRVRGPFNISNAFTVSIGIADYNPKLQGANTKTLRDRADVALYNSKRDAEGNRLKNRVTVYKEGMTIPPGARK